jgi:pimeloyl-ACP methyl ester carboxylesterase
MVTLQPGCALARPRILHVGDLRLNALEWGRAGSPGLALLHGGSAHAHWFDLVAPAFADRYHVLSLDQRGHGESDWAVPAAYGTEDFVADLLRVLDALGWDQAVVVGHSMGGHNALAFAAWHPARVRALVIVDSRPSLPQERLERLRSRGRRAPRLHPTLESALAAFRLLPPETVADPALLAHLASVGVTQRDGGWVYRFDPDCSRLRRPIDAWPLLGRIGAPTLIVRGERSHLLPTELAERMRAAIPGAVVAEIPGAYHHLVLDAPAAFVEVLARFLESTNLHRDGGLGRRSR